MMPCPNGKVPYSQQKCFENGNSFPDVAWVEQMIQQKEIDYLGEILSQYYGISSSDTILVPYYKLAIKYNIPVGIHTGSAGPNHGSPNFSEEMGNPELLRATLTRFPTLRVWIMHAGAPYVKETLSIMKDFPQVYTDLSAINFPPIMPTQQFQNVLKQLMDAGLEDRVMFGSDNNDIAMVISSIESAPFLTGTQKDKIFFANAEKFFGK
jgi:predicted TIM-barrel fold metal-dependent hydrolase